MLDWGSILALAKNGNVKPPRTVSKSETEWRDILTPEQYNVLRQHGTERPFSNEMCSLFQPGLYACGACETELFDASNKFESGTGWPSFSEPVESNVVAYNVDESHGMVRVETLCNVCGSHLGHVFPDGPEPTGLRFCINAAALTKVSD